MKKEQEEKLTDAISERMGKYSSEAWEEIWQACLDANGIGETPDPDDNRYEIGEEVEVYNTESKTWNKGKIAASNANTYALSSKFVRRKPAWTPKEGEAVFALSGGKTIVAKVIGIREDWVEIDYDGRTCKHSVSYRGPEVYAKPFDVSKIGRPWDEI